MPRDTESTPTTLDAETFARRCDPEIWSLEPPDISSAHMRSASLVRAKLRLGLLWWNPTTENYENVKRT